MHNEITPDYELRLQIRNGLMLSAMRRNGYDTAAQLSRDCGVQQVTIGKYLSLKRTLYDHNGNLRSDIIKIAETLNENPMDLVPENHWFDPIIQSEIRAGVSCSQMRMLANKSMSSLTEDPAHLLEILESESRDVFADILKIGRLTRREEYVMRLRFIENKTLEEIGKNIGITRTRVMQIEQNATWKLRNAARGDVAKLEGAAGIYFDEISAIAHHEAKP